MKKKKHFYQYNGESPVCFVSCPWAPNRLYKSTDQSSHWSHKLRTSQIIWSLYNDNRRYLDAVASSPKGVYQIKYTLIKDIPVHIWDGFYDLFLSKPYGGGNSTLPIPAVIGSYPLACSWLGVQIIQQFERFEPRSCIWESWVVWHSLTSGAWLWV